MFYRSNSLLNQLVYIRRTLFKPPSNVPYAGVYRKDGEICRQNELLVVQRKINYHPGSNVSLLNFI